MTTYAGPAAGITPIDPADLPATPLAPERVDAVTALVLEGKTAKEIAAALGVGITTARTWIHDSRASIDAARMAAKPLIQAQLEAQGEEAVGVLGDAMKAGRNAMNGGAGYSMAQGAAAMLGVKAAAEVLDRIGVSAEKEASAPQVQVNTQVVANLRELDAVLLGTEGKGT